MAATDQQEVINEQIERFYELRMERFTGAVYMKFDKQPTETIPAEISEALEHIHPEVMKRYLACGKLAPMLMAGLDVVDLGSASGWETFLFSRLIGATGSIVGIDITDRLVKFADGFREWHREKFGHTKSNTTFKTGSIENLKQFGLQDNSLDLACSNGVICLVPDRRAVYTDTYRVLKYGGEFIMFDSYAASRIPIPEGGASDKLWNEGLYSGYWRDMIDMCVNVGFTCPRIVTKVNAHISDSDVWASTGNVPYRFVAYRMFKLPKNTDSTPCRATYRGGIPSAEEIFEFDRFTTFKKSEHVVVDGELAAILKNSRFAPHFEFTAKQNDDIIETKDPLVNPFDL